MGHHSCSSCVASLLKLGAFRPTRSPGTVPKTVNEAVRAEVSRTLVEQLRPGFRTGPFCVRLNGCRAPHFGRPTILSCRPAPERAAQLPRAGWGSA